MLRWSLSAMVTIPAATAMVAFAVANRHDVTVSFDPFDPTDSTYSSRLPLYLFGFAVLLAGVLLGGFATWLRQARWRRSGARLAAELRAIREELDEFKQMRHNCQTFSAPLSPRPPAAWNAIRLDADRQPL
jgi:uncharacterized integral membrane protein